MPAANAILAVAPVAGLFANCVVHLIGARLIGKRGPYPAVFLGAAAGVVITSSVSAGALTSMELHTGDGPAFMFLNLATNLALAFGYFNFVNLNIASLRIRVLSELSAAGGKLRTTAILEQYNDAGVFDTRMRRLIKGGHIQERDGRLHRGRLKFLCVARVFNAMRWVILGHGNDRKREATPHDEREK